MDGYWIDINGKKEIIKQGTKVIWCKNRQLTELILPDGIKRVYCNNNQITELTLPNDILVVRCDKTVDIKNLDDFIGRDNVLIKFM